MSTSANADCGGLLDQHRQHLQPLRAEHDVDHVAVGLLEQRVAFLLRHAAGDGDERPAPGLLAEHAQLAEPRIELLLGVLADAAGVDDDDVGVALVVGRLVAGLLQQARHPLGVVDVHLAAERLDEVFLGHVACVARARRLSLSPFAFRLSLSPSLAASRQQLAAPLARDRAR